MRHPTQLFWTAFALIAAGLALPLLRVFELPVASAADHRAVAASAWIAAFYWFVGVLLLTGDLGSEYPDPAARAWWSAGFLFAGLHTAIAFHAVHGWSHAAAFEHTAGVGGLGAGVYVNYLFLTVWAADVVLMWTAPRAYQRRSRWLTWTAHTFLAFVVFNATVVFATSPVRWVAAAAFGLLIWQWTGCWFKRTSSSRADSS